MEVNISDSICHTKIFCKTDHFPFNVITFPFLESNIDEDLCYRVFYSQIIRFQRLCSHRTDFEDRTRLLGTALLDRGYRIYLLERQFCRVIDKYIKEFQKWIIPLDLRAWFKQIFNNQPTGNIPPRPISMAFSQPLSNLDNIAVNRASASQP